MICPVTQSVKNWLFCIFDRLRHGYFILVCTHIHTHTHNKKIKYKSDLIILLGLSTNYFEKNKWTLYARKKEKMSRGWGGGGGGGGGKTKKKCGPTISDGLPTDAHSQVRSHYCATRSLLPAVFPPWAGSTLLRQPGPPKLPSRAHIDAGLSADTRSTWYTCWQDSRPQTVPISSLQVAGLQEHATTPSERLSWFLLSKSFQDFQQPEYPCDLRCQVQCDHC